MERSRDGMPVECWREQLQDGRRSALAEVAMPPEAAGWVLIGRLGTGEPTPVLRDVLHELHLLGQATMLVSLPRRGPAAGAELVSLAAAQVRTDLAPGLPLTYMGAGHRAGPGWIASLDGDLDGVVSWNGRAARVWRQLPRVAVPSLLVLDDQAGRWRAAATRATCRHLGGPAELARCAGPGDLAPLSAWFGGLLLGPTPVRAQPPHRRRIKVVRAASVAAVSALAALPAALPAAGLPDFSAGTRLSVAQRGGDVPAELASSAAPYKPGDKNHALGVLGDPPLTDGIGFRWNVNTNVGFTTSSSASGAVSEAAFTHAVAASTLNGGTVNQVLNDAFDGYNALCVDVNNVGGQCNTANMAVYNQNGPASLECSGRQVVLPPRTIGPLQVRRKVFVPTNDGFARWLDIVKNTSGVTQTVRLVTSNNLGSDAGTRVVTTSDGDATAELTDTWVTTFQNFSGTTSSDPRLGHVLQGPGAPVGLAAIQFVNGDDNPFWRYQFPLAPGQTAIIMNFATGQPTKAAAAAMSASLASLTNPNALACMTPTEVSQVRNFLTRRTLPGVVTGSTSWSLRDTLTSGPPTIGPFLYGTKPLSPLMGDWDGDGIKTVGTFENGVFKLRNSNTAGPPDLTVTFGDPRGFPVAGDFDGDTRDDLAVFRAGTWQIHYSGGAPDATFVFGSGTWPATVPVAGDWDGDGIDGIGTYSGGVWNLRNTASAGAADAGSFTYAPVANSYPVVGDWDSNKTDTVGVKETTGTQWLLRNSNTAGAPDLTIDFGAANDLPVVWQG